MATAISSSPSTKKISALINDIKRGDLVLQPEFQRKLVWNPKHKEAFIDTILQGFPFPEIYIAESGIDLETLETQQVVVDGQQRLSTIMEYVGGGLDCKRIVAFADLDTQSKKDFLNYDVVVRDLKDTAPDIIKEVFRRINQTKYNLNSVEIQNAIYDGEFITTAKEILTLFDRDSLPVFSDNDVSRMEDLNFTLQLMATYEEGGYFGGNTRTEKFIMMYNDEYPNKEQVKDIFGNLIHLIIELTIPRDSMWFRKSNFFTLFVEMLKVRELPSDIRDRLFNFENRVLQNKGNDNSEYGKYYSVMFTGTNSRSARLLRGELFKRGVVKGENLD